jgi:hypothetical protein
LAEKRGYTVNNEALKTGLGPKLLSGDHAHRASAESGAKNQVQQSNAGPQRFREIKCANESWMNEKQQNKRE